MKRTRLRLIPTWTRWLRRRRDRTFDENVCTTEFLDILARARDGDGGGITTLYNLLQPRLTRYLAVMIPAHAERVAAETWLELLGRLKGFDGDEHALYVMAFTAARRRVNRTARLRAETSSGDRLPLARAARPVADDAMAGIDLGSSLASIARLPRGQAEVVLLRVLGDLSVEEVADLVEQRPDSIRALQSEALHALNWVPAPERAAVS